MKDPFRKGNHKNPVEKVCSRERCARRGMLALNSRLLLEGSLKNMVFCSPARPLNRMWGSMINWMSGQQWLWLGWRGGYERHMRWRRRACQRECKTGPTLTLCSPRRSARRSNPSQLRTQPKWGTGTSSPSTGLVWSSLFLGCGWTVSGASFGMRAIGDWGEATDTKTLLNRNSRSLPCCR